MGGRKWEMGRESGRWGGRREWERGRWEVGGERRTREMGEERVDGKRGERGWEKGRRERGERVRPREVGGGREGERKGRERGGER